MSLSTDLVNLFRLLCELRTKNLKTVENILSYDVNRVNNNFDESLNDIKSHSLFLNLETANAIKGRVSSNVISVGRESSALLLSLQKLATNVMNAETGNHQKHLEDAVKHNVSNAEDELGKLEDYIKSTRKFIQDCEYIVKHIRPKQNGENCSNVSEMSFFPMDLATSSPMN